MQDIFWAQQEKLNLYIAEETKKLPTNEAACSAPTTEPVIFPERMKQPAAPRSSEIPPEGGGEAKAAANQRQASGAAP